MEKYLSWLKEQWTDKRFRIYLAVILIAGIGLAAIFFILSYSLLKAIRYLILYAVLFLIAWNDGKKKRIPNKILKVLLGIRCVLMVLEWLRFPKLGLALLMSAALGALLGALMLGAGACHGQFAVLWKKAAMICLECIGIG